MKLGGDISESEPLLLSSTKPFIVSSEQDETIEVPTAEAFFSEDELEEDSIEVEGDALHRYEHFRLVVDTGQTPLRIDKFLVNKMEHCSRNRISQAAEAGAIYVGECPVKSNYRVRPGDVITLRLLKPPHERGIVAEDIPLEIIYEDDLLLVINKAAGMVVHPGNGNFTGTLVNALAYYLRNNPLYDPLDPAVGLVHRIDKDTSGLIVVAKRPEAKTFLARQFFDKTTERTYHALAWGNISPPEGIIEGNIGRDPKDRTRMTVFAPDRGEGKPAVTHYRVLESLTFVSLVACNLETGRTHQIRTHLKHINHPLLGDARYGGDKILRGRQSATYLSFAHNALALCPRQALHAYSLGFTHPATGEFLRFQVEEPEDMRLLIDKWRHYTATTLS